MEPCPTCGKSLRTEQGMRQHHTKIHGDPLPNRTCKGCGVEFYDPKARLTFCDDCNPNGGPNNGNWKDAKDVAECRLCRNEFEYYPSDKKDVYCPECVAKSDIFLGEPYVKDAKRITKECDYCGIEMDVLQSTLDRGEGRFCDFDCLCDWMAKDGRADPTAYGQNWKPIKQQALDRDNHTCQYCGITANELGQEPDVHHIKPIREFDKPADAHTLDNVICLCRGCHRRVEVGNIQIP